MAVIYLMVQFEPDLSDAGGPDAVNFHQHKAPGVDEPVQTPDGRESRTLVKGSWGTEILSELVPEPGTSSSPSPLQRLLRDGAGRDPSGARSRVARLTSSQWVSRRVRGRTPSSGRETAARSASSSRSSARSSSSSE